MSKPKKIARYFKTAPGTGAERARKDLFEALKQKKLFSIKDIAKNAGVPQKTAADSINRWVKKDLVKISGAEKEGVINFNSEHCEILGVGFGEDKVILVVMDLAGNILAREQIAIKIPRKEKLKNKEIERMIAELGQKTGFAGKKFCCTGIALPERMDAANPKSAEILTKSIRRIWRVETYIAREATAAGYAEKDFGVKNMSSDEAIYMHTDKGIGAVIKKEAVFEPDERARNKDRAYLRPWDQFGVVSSTRRLIDKGVGTDIVGMVAGDVGNIRLDTVLKAADNKDELAEDLVKRSALALGVRVAYLVNMFGVENVVLGGGTEIKEGSFLSHVKESADKFVLNKAKKKMKIIPGALGEEAPSIGAAGLCRLRLFVEE